MGNKQTTLAVDEAKLATPFGSCGWSKCKSTCCEKEEDPQLKQIQIAIRVELASLERLLLERMLAQLKANGVVPVLSVLPAEVSAENHVTIRI